MSTTDQPEPQRPSIFVVLRAFVRQASAAVYVFIGYALFVHLLSGRTWATRLEPAFALLGGALTALVIEGPWWTSGLVGLFLALLDSIFLVVTHEEDEAIALPIAMNVVLLTIAGAVGAALARRRQLRKGAA